MGPGALQDAHGAHLSWSLVFLGSSGAPFWVVSGITKENDLDKDIEVLILTVLRDYPYLLA